LAERPAARVFPSQLLLLPRPVPTEMPDARGSPRLPCSRLGRWDPCCLLGPAPSPPAQGALSTPITPASASGQPSPSAEGHYLCVEDAVQTPWLSQAHRNKTNFICATCRGFPSTYCFPQHYCTLYAESSAIIAPQWLKTMPISIAVQLTLRIRLFCRQRDLLNVLRKLLNLEGLLHP